MNQREKILVIDDNREIRSFIINCILIPNNYHVISANDGKTGLELALTSKPDLILCDMNLPIFSGMQIIAALNQASYRIPIILMTGYGSEAIVAEAFRMGVQDYLRKPFKAEDCLRSIERILSLSRMAQQRAILENNLLAAETVRKTVITITHHVNNALMTLTGSMTLLEENISVHYQNSDVNALFSESKESLHYIQSVLQVLQQITHIQTSDYSKMDESKIIDIEKELEKILSASKLNKKF